MGEFTINVNRTKAYQQSFQRTTLKNYSLFVIERCGSQPRVVSGFIKLLGETNGRSRTVAVITLTLTALDISNSLIEILVVAGYRRVDYHTVNSGMALSNLILSNPNKLSPYAYPIRSSLI